MKQTRSRFARWRVAGLAVLLAASLVALVPLTISAVDQAKFSAGWAAYKSGDYATALREWRPLAEHGHVKAQHNIGSMYLRGEGVPKNYAEAEKWTRKAAEQGRAIARTNLGWMYHSGRGVPRDYAEAVMWYRMAAEQNEAQAQTNLGLMYARGESVPQDFVRAHMWISLAAAQGLKRAVKFRNISEKKQLTPAQLAEARRLAREWREEHGHADEAQGTIAIVVDTVAAAVDTTLARILAVVSPRKSAPTIVGEWQSAPVLGQLGLIQTTVTFNEDGSFSMKGDFISFRDQDPDLEYFWNISNGTYSVAGDKVTLDFDKTWFVRKMRGEDEAKEPPEPVRGKARREVAHWKDGKLMMKDMALERIK